MKKTLIRTLSLVLTVSALMGVLTTGASAFEIINHEVGIKTGGSNSKVTLSTPENTPELYSEAELKQIARNYACASGPFKVIRTDLSKLAAYMPHVSNIPKVADGVSANSVTGFRYRSITIRALSTEAAARNMLNLSNASTARSETSGLHATILSRMNDITLSHSAEITLISGQVVETLRNASISNAYVMVNGQLQAPNTQPETNFIEVGSTTRMWLTDSMRNDKSTQNLVMSEEVFYYGENTFRSSALETVVFPWNLFSDHVIPQRKTRVYGSVVDFDIYGDIKNANRTLAGLVTGKEAIIIAKNSFADCAKLTSVIFPTEPARLYFEDGVFANCPKLTVYAPAGGYVESYCKANGIKFQAVADGYIEPKVETAPTLRVVDHYEPVEYQPDRDILESLAYEFIPYYTHKTIPGYEPDFPNARVIVNESGLDKCGLEALIGEPLTPAPAGVLDYCSCKNCSMAFAGSDINRYRSDAARQFTMDTRWVYEMPFLGIDDLGLYWTKPWNADQVMLREHIKQWIKFPA